MTATKRPKKGAPKPLAVAAVPNPQWGVALSLAVQLESDADSLVIEAFTPGMSKVLREEVRGPFGAGWNAVSCGKGGLGNGLYYVVVRGKLDSGEAEEGPVAKLCRLE